MFNQITGICVFQLFHLSEEVFCSSKAKQCPEDKYYNPKIHNCTDCPSGYYGPNCSNSCRYPLYGVKCQEECHCPKKTCDPVFGFLDYGLDGHDYDNGLQVIIGLSFRIGVVLVIAAFLVITVANGRFYTRHIRENAHYIGSAMTEHSITTDMYKPPESSTRYCSESEPTNSGVYMLAGTRRYETVNLQ